MRRKTIKSLRTVSPFLVVLDGISLMDIPSSIETILDGVPTKVSLDDAQLEGTVLQSLLDGQGHSIHIETNKGIVSLYVPPVSIKDLCPELVFDSSNNFIGTALRLPGLHSYLNSIIVNMEKNNPPDLRLVNANYVKYMASIIENNLLKFKLGPGLSGPALGGDTFLHPLEVGIPTEMAFRLANSIFDSLKTVKGIEKTVSKFNKVGPESLNGLQVSVKREPATVKEAVLTYTLKVVDVPGRSIFIRSDDIGNAGGDFDGDSLTVLVLDPKQAISLINKSSKIDPIIKPEAFSIGTTLVKDKDYKVSIGLDTCIWFPESEIQTMKEAQEKGNIGLAWYVLQHYNYLLAHHYSLEDLSAKVEDAENKYTQLMEAANKSPKSQFYKTIVSFSINHYQKSGGFFLLDSAGWDAWYTVCYTASAHAFFPLYEIIFDMRKGDYKPPFNPVEVLSGLLGSKSLVPWAQLEKAGIETVPLRLVYNSLAISYAGSEPLPNVEATMLKHPTFRALVSMRNQLGSLYENPVQILIHRDYDNFTLEVMNELIRGIHV